MPPRRRAATSTSNFGVGRRESHVADAFYARFEAPEVCDDEHVTPMTPGGACLRRRPPHGRGADGSVALVVTSPPYFAGKQYEEELDREGVPGSYLEYLDLLRESSPSASACSSPAGVSRSTWPISAASPTAACRPTSSRSSRTTSACCFAARSSGRRARGERLVRLGLVPRAANPVLRDITERVVVASKGRFDRAAGPEGAPGRRAAAREHPHDRGLHGATLDLWNIPPESARGSAIRRPFPVELPERLIRLYTYKDDLVLDPFMGLGLDLVAAARSAARRRATTSTPDT